MLEEIKLMHEEVQKIIMKLPSNEYSNALNVFHNAYPKHRKLYGGALNLEREDYHKRMQEGARFMKKTLIGYVDHRLREL